MNKYRSQPTEVDGIRFHSKAEARRWGELKLLERAGAISGLQRQVPFKCVHGGRLITTWVADFVYFDSALSKRVVEDVKGFRTREYKLKKTIVEAFYPGVVIQEVRA